MEKLKDLNSDQIQILRDSFDLLEPEFENIISDLYPTFMARNPEYADYFENTDFSLQRSAVINLFKKVITNLDDPESISSRLNELSDLHEEHNVPEESYEAMGEVVIELLSDYAGDHWNDELEETWGTFWQILSTQLSN